MSFVMILHAKLSVELTYCGLGKSLPRDSSVSRYKGGTFYGLYKKKLVWLYFMVRGVWFLFCDDITRQTVIGSNILDEEKFYRGLGGDLRGRLINCKGALIEGPFKPPPIR